MIPFKILETLQENQKTGDNLRNTLLKIADASFAKFFHIQVTMKEIEELLSNIN